MSVSQRALGRQVGSGLFTRQRMIPLALAVVALFLAFLIVHDVLAPPAPAAASIRSVAVTTGTVSSAVSGTGTVVPIQQQNINFPEAGMLSEVDVKVGDTVTAGQVLARLDPTTFQQALQQAQNNLASAQAQLDNTLNGNAVVQAEHSLSSAQQSQADTQAAVNLSNQQDANAIANDQNALNTDSASATTAQNTLNSAQAKLDQDTANRLIPAQNQFNADQCGTSTPGPNCASDQANLTTAQTIVSSDNSALTAARSAFTAAQSAVSADQSRMTTDQNKQASDRIANQRSLDQASSSVTSAQDQLNSQTISRPNTITQQESSVSNAQLSVATAQRNLNQATLTAPFGGTVLSISGQPGEDVGGGASATTMSPGSSAPLPSASGATSSSSASSGQGAAGSGGGFMVLGNVSGYQVIAPFAEADASRLAAGNPATVTFDAITNLTLNAHVLAIATSSTVISNVTNYYATLVLDQPDLRLKSGMTANANVIVQNVTNVLTVVNSAITHIGSNAYVTLLGKDGKTETRQLVQTGAVGDNTTEITGGLNLGDRVVLPTLSAPTGTTGAGAGRGGGFVGGGGGGGVRVGG